MTGQVDVGGLAIAFEDVAGPAERRPLLMVHGFTGHRDDFAEVRDELARDRRVIVPDLRGHGDSGRTGRVADYRFARVVEDLVALLDTLGVERCHLLGHSMGGMVALRLALAHPDRLASLIAMNTAPEAPPHLRGDGLAKAAHVALTHGMGVLQERVEAAGRRRPDPIVAGWAERYWRHHRRRYLAMDPAAYAGFSREMVEQESLVERLDAIRVPCLVVVGEGDAEFLPGADRLEVGIPSARRVTLAGAGHHPHQEARTAWLAALRDHLASAEPGVADAR